jgi:hypothetical protein
MHNFPALTVELPLHWTGQSSPLVAFRRLLASRAGRGKMQDSQGLLSRGTEDSHGHAFQESRARARCR